MGLFAHLSCKTPFFMPAFTLWNFQIISVFIPDLYYFNLLLLNAIYFINSDQIDNAIYKMLQSRIINVNMTLK